MIALLDLLSPADFAALIYLLLAWTGIGWRIEHKTLTPVSVSIVMAQFRREWLRQMINRDPRIFDAQMIGHLRQGASFFASATMLAIGGGLALVGNTEPLRRVARDLTIADTPALLWEIKLILIVLLISTAFLRYVWAHRLFGYTAVLMAAVPNDPKHPDCAARADQAADISILAARAFTRGMRTTYFALAACAWLLGPWALMIAITATLGMLLRREFSSNARDALLKITPPQD
ncbi:MAG: DUF599 domain-containing protein [Paracoccaceae bacterium]